MELIGIVMSNIDVAQLVTLLTLICCTAYWDNVDQLEYIDKRVTLLITCSTLIIIITELDLHWLDSNTVHTGLREPIKVLNNESGISIDPFKPGFDVTD